MLWCPKRVKRQVLEDIDNHIIGLLGLQGTAKPPLLADPT